MVTVPGQIRNTLLEKGGPGGPERAGQEGWRLGVGGRLEPASGRGAGRRPAGSAFLVSCDSSSRGGPWQLPRPHSEKSGTAKALRQKGLWPEGLQALWGQGHFQFRGAPSNPGVRLEADCPPRGIT